MTRSLSQLWRHGTAEEKEFVRRLLLSYSGGKDVTAKVWRLAEQDWIKAVRLQDARGEPDSEFAAMVLLGILISADEALGE
jgi:hypothetical protein